MPPPSSTRHPAAPSALVDQRGEMGQRALRTLVTQCGELAFGRLGLHASGELDGRTVDGFEQRLVEELGVQAGNPQTLTFELLPQHAQGVVLTVGSHVRRPGQPPHRLFVVGLGQHVGALEPLQLQAVFEQPQELVRRAHVGGVVTPHVSACPQRRERVDGRRDVE